MTNLFQKTRQFVEESFNNTAQMLHFDRTVYWLQYLKPDADEAFLIAAIGHDIEKASRMGKEGLGRTDKGFLDKDDLTYHQERGAAILGDFLEKHSADGTTVKKVKHLVSKHEVGGDADQNLLKDADSLSFLENNTQIFLSRIEKLGYKAIKEKFDWMYNRISDPKAKEIAKPFYEKMMSELNQLKS
jgi:hypothetical protein